MSKNEYVPLCFGTYAAVLFLCSAAGVTKIELVSTIVKSVDSNCLMTHETVNQLLNCRSGLPTGRGKHSLGNVTGKARKACPEKVKDYFLQNIVPLISPQQRLGAFKAIKHIIENDKLVDPRDIAGLEPQGDDYISKEELAELLASSFLYTTYIDNKVGQKAIASINHSSINSL